MRPRRTIGILMLFAACLAANAQFTRTLTGNVIDKNGIPVLNAFVQATGGWHATLTDSVGAFRLEVPAQLKSLTILHTGVGKSEINVAKHQSDDLGVIVLGAEKERSWFVDLYSGTIAPWIGVSFGQLGNWGWYVRFGMQSFTAGVSKHLYKAMHLYAGCGLCNPFVFIDEIGAVQIDLGLMFKFNNFNFSIGPTMAMHDIYWIILPEVGLGYSF